MIRIQAQSNHFEVDIKLSNKNGISFVRDMHRNYLKLSNAKVDGGYEEMRNGRLIRYRRFVVEPHNYLRMQITHL